VTGPPDRVLARLYASKMTDRYTDLPPEPPSALATVVLHAVPMVRLRQPDQPDDVIAAQAAVVRPMLLRRPSSTARCQSAT
jgi:hypothetical protein